MEQLHQAVIRAAQCCAAFALFGAGCILPGTKSDDNGGAALGLLALAANASSAARVSCSALAGSPPAGTALADTVTSAAGDTSNGFGNARCATNGIRGEGNDQGSTDVFSLASTGSTAVMVLSFSGGKITNGAGTDFVVFENPFNYNGSSSTRFMEPIVVEVSYDGSSWCGFNPSYASGTYSTNPANWVRFGGVAPVLYNQDTNPMSSATLFASGGGDAFDLSNLAAGTTTGANCLTVATNSGCTAGTVSALQGSSTGQGVRYVRLISATACTNPNAGSAAFPQDSGAFGGGPDIDGIIARYPASL